MTVLDDEQPAYYCPDEKWHFPRPAEQNAAWSACDRWLIAWADTGPEWGLRMHIQCDFVRHVLVPRADRCPECWADYGDVR